ncbi:uncharacterized protein LOC122084825 [Macadamia integrifolia]|uniref:uncharacterized protein LOC122084825 n=1 Tax=Macadamia integrifolia TaxID=60698 RepID=UPI001C4E43CB|nr:uncharacterized protein LOC122084825 [Macadamia integrifolia]
MAEGSPGDDPGGGLVQDMGRHLWLTDFWKALPSSVSAVSIGDIMEEGGSEWESPAQKSFAKTVDTVLPVVDDLPEPVHAGNSTKVIIPQEEYEDHLHKYKFSLIGRINFCFISLDDVRREAREIWKLKGKVKMVPMGKGFTIFQFDSEKDMALMWRRSPVKVGRQYVRFQRWHPDFSIHEKQINKALVWVRFPDLPLEYWYEKFKQQVLYEDSLGQCGFCKKLGHQVHACREKKAHDEKQNSLDKAGLPGAVYEEDRVDSGRGDSLGQNDTSMERFEHDLMPKNSNVQQQFQNAEGGGIETVPTTISSSRFPSMERGEILIDLIASNHNPSHTNSGKQILSQDKEAGGMETVPKESAQEGEESNADSSDDDDSDSTKDDVDRYGSEMESDPDQLDAVDGGEPNQIGIHSNDEPAVMPPEDD